MSGGRIPDLVLRHGGGTVTVTREELAEARTSDISNRVPLDALAWPEPEYHLREGRIRMEKQLRDNGMAPEAASAKATKHAHRMDRGVNRQT